jgi:hypothetical protein
MHRLYFLAPDLDMTWCIVDALKNIAGIDDHQLGVVAAASTPLGDLPEASVWETTQVARGIEGGLLVGGAAGLIGSLLAVTLPPAGLALAGSAVLATSAASAGFAAVVTGLIAKDMPKKDVEALRGAIMAGHILILVDVSRKRKPEIIQSLKAVYPNTVIHTATATSPLEGPLAVVSR